MPKVGIFTFRHKALPNGWQDFDIIFGSLYSKGRVKLENKKFCIAFPPEVGTFTSSKGIEAGTVDEVKRLFSDAMNNYYNQKRETRKVIGYRYGFETIKSENDSWDVNNNKSHFDEKRVFVLETDEAEKFPSQKLSFEFVIGLLHTMGEKDFFEFEEKGNPHRSGTLHQITGQGRYGSYTVFKFIDHTPEREAWFRETYKGLNKMINAVRGFFSQDEDKLLAAIENPARLLKF